jgi:hypothetical protein
MRLLLTVMVCVVFVVGLAASAQATPIVANGDFSAPDLSGGWGYYPNLTAAQQAAAIWTVSGAPCFAHNGAPWGVPAGNDSQFVWFQPDTASGGVVALHQTLTGFDVGTSYKVNYQDTQLLGTETNLSVIIDQGLATETNLGALTSGSSGSWGSVSTNSFVAAKSSYTLTFLTTDPGTYGGNQVVAIDNVSVSSVPEPSVVVLGLTGIVGLLAYAWRKRK